MKAQQMAAYLRDVREVAARYGTAIDTSFHLIESYEDDNVHWALNVHTALSQDPAMEFWHEIGELPSYPEGVNVWVEWALKETP